MKKALSGGHVKAWKMLSLPRVEVLIFPHFIIRMRIMMLEFNKIKDYNGWINEKLVININIMILLILLSVQLSKKCFNLKTVDTNLNIIKSLKNKKSYF